MNYHTLLARGFFVFPSDKKEKQKHLPGHGNQLSASFKTFGGKMSKSFGV